MTEILVDKSFDTQGTSSAIRGVFYSTEERKIFFEFLSGTVAGYAGVPEDIYTALETLNENRINGDENSSVGNYYNRFFRSTGYFAGVETGDLEIITPEQVKLQEIAEANAAEIAAEQSLKAADVFEGEVDLSEEPIQAENVFIAPLDSFAQDVAGLPSVLRRFGVAFIYDENQEISFNVHATDEDDALVRFNTAVELLGWDVKIVSLTRFFD